MKSRGLLFCLAASFFALPGCQSTGPHSEKTRAGPAIVTIELRGHLVTFHVGPGDTRYTVTNLRGDVLAREASRDELKSVDPEIYELVRNAVVLAERQKESPLREPLHVLEHP